MRLTILKNTTNPLSQTHIFLLMFWRAGDSAVIVIFFSFTNLCQVVVIYTFYFADTLSSLWNDGTLSLYIQFLLGKAGTSAFVYQDLHGSSSTGMRLVTSTISSNSSNSINNILIIVLIVFY